MAGLVGLFLACLLPHLIAKLAGGRSPWPTRFLAAAARICGAEVRLKRISTTGDASPAVVVASSDAARSSGFPRMVRVGDEVLFAWTQPGDSARVRMATARLAGKER